MNLTVNFALDSIEMHEHNRTVYDVTPASPTKVSGFTTHFNANLRDIGASQHQIEKVLEGFEAEATVVAIPDRRTLCGYRFEIYC